MFTLTVTQQGKIDEWIKEQNALMVAEQKNSPMDVPFHLLESAWEAGVPYTGAIGGLFTYMFTPSSLGVIVQVRNAITLDKIDVTDYENW